MNYRIITEPAQELITLADAKNFLRVSDSVDDTLITALIKVARRTCERYTKRAFITQTWEIWMDSFPTIPGRGEESWWDGVRDGAISMLYTSQRFIEFPMAPLQSIVAFNYFDVNDTQSAFDFATNCVVSVARTPGRIALKTGQVWPIATRGADAIQIQFKAGYGDAPTNVPDDLIQAVRLLVGHLYENREPVEIAKAGGALEMPLSVDALLNPYVVRRV